MEEKLTENVWRRHSAWEVAKATHLEDLAWTCMKHQALLLEVAIRTCTRREFPSFSGLHLCPIQKAPCAPSPALTQCLPLVPAAGAQQSQASEFGSGPWPANQEKELFIK